MSVMADEYWESRAQEYAGEGAGLRAVCSYGMPGFYNWTIHWTQKLALRRWLAVSPGTRVLDVGCGVGRWSRQLARRGADVTGVDLSPTMIAQAEERTAGSGLSAHCNFRVADLTTLALDAKYSFILGVTVLQHILDDAALDKAIANLARHLDAGGRMVLLEAAPTKLSSRCDTAVFRARTADMYRERFERAGLRLVTVTGVDPAPFKTQFLPYYRRLPRPVAAAILGVITLIGAPLDLLAGRRLPAMSWHKIFVLEKGAC